MKASHKRRVLGLCIDYLFWKRVIIIWTASLRISLPGNVNNSKLMNPP